VYKAVLVPVNAFFNSLFGIYTCTTYIAELLGPYLGRGSWPIVIFHVSRVYIDVYFIKREKIARSFSLHHQTADSAITIVVIGGS
jgi:hypothetical protein